MCASEGRSFSLRLSLIQIYGKEWKGFDTTGSDGHSYTSLSVEAGGKCVSAESHVVVSGVLPAEPLQLVSVFTCARPEPCRLTSLSRISMCTYKLLTLILFILYNK